MLKQFEMLRKIYDGFRTLSIIPLHGSMASILIVGVVEFSGNVDRSSHGCASDSSAVIRVLTN